MIDTLGDNVALYTIIDKKSLVKNEHFENRKEIRLI